METLYRRKGIVMKTTAIIKMDKKADLTKLSKRMSRVSNKEKKFQAAPIYEGQVCLPENEIKKYHSKVFLEELFLKMSSSFLTELKDLIEKDNARPRAGEILLKAVEDTILEKDLENRKEKSSSRRKK